MSWRCRSKRGRQAFANKTISQTKPLVPKSSSTPISDKKVMRMMKIQYQPRINCFVQFQLNRKRTEMEESKHSSSPTQVISCRGRIRHQVCLRGGHRPCNCWVSSPYVPPRHQAAGSGGVRISARGSPNYFPAPRVCVPPTCVLWATKLSISNL